MGNKFEVLSLYAALDHESSVGDHIKRVCDLCRRFAVDGIRLNGDLLLSAALFHDLAPDHDTHHKPKRVKRAIKQAAGENTLQEIPRLDDVCAIIEAHRKSFSPPKHLAMEAAVLRLSDKLDRYYKGKADAAQKCQNSLRAVEGFFEGEGMSEEFKCLSQRYYEIEADVRRDAGVV